MAMNIIFIKYVHNDKYYLYMITTYLYSKSDDHAYDT